MAKDSHQPSFSRGRKFAIGVNVVLAAAVVLAVLVMVNYLSSRYYKRVHLSTNTGIQLWPRTVSVLHSLTNRIQVTLYYDREDALYSTVSSLLKEYQAVNSKLTVQNVDYLRDAGAAQIAKTKYKLTAPTEKNLVIFDCDGHIKVIEGDTLAKYVMEQVPNPNEREFRRKPTEFLGQEAFTGALLAVSNPKPLKAYFLQGHDERALDDGSDMGFMKFKSILQQNYIQVEPLTLLGTNPVPFDCNLLIIAGPRDALADSELEKVGQYLREGGRLFALFNVVSQNKKIGLEKILAEWGVNVTDSIVKDPDNTTTESLSDLIVSNFSKHPVVNPLTLRQIQLLLPRVISKTALPQTSDAPQVEEIAFSGPRAVASGSVAQTPPFPLMVAVQKNSVKGVVTERGSTRILVVGDSLFLGNRQIESGANRDFLSFCANWLLDRGALLQETGPRAITEYHLVMPKSQRQMVEWILMAGLPGVVLLFGGLVWLRRRK
ncbi:MAG: gliding motility-associatede transport system auxiliary component [Verrucomicrobiota bacterium]|jgi:ABC-type uncharacterized transport system involved in gliding motility auxiliary subunit